MGTSKFIAILSVAIAIVLGRPSAADDSEHKPYLPLAHIAVAIRDGQMPRFIQTITVFAASRNFRLVLGNYPKFSRSVTNLKMHVGKDSYFYGSNFLSGSSFELIAHSHEDDSVWRQAWNELIASISSEFGEVRIIENR